MLIKGLTEESIDRAIACFRDAINTRKHLPSDFHPKDAQEKCNRILDLTAEGSYSTDNVRRIPRFWVNLNALAHNSNLNALESCITRVYCMRSALCLHRWLLQVVPPAVERTSRNTWIDRLVWDVGTAMDGKKTVDFNSESYIPNLKQPSTFSLTPGRRIQYEKSDLLVSMVSSIIRKWLQFPTDELSLVQLSVIDIVCAKCPKSVMFLDVIWETYKTPFATIFNKWQILRSKSKMVTELKAFEEGFSSHPFTNTTSLEHQKLKYLNGLIQEWMNKEWMNKETVSVCPFLYI